MKFLFDMPDSEALPRTYDLMEEVGAFAKEAKLSEANREVTADTTQVTKLITNPNALDFFILAFALVR